MSKLGFYLLLTSGAALIGCVAYVSARAGVIRSPRALTGCALGVGFLMGSFGTSTLCIWLLDQSTWGWLREILGPLGGAAVGYLAARHVEGGSHEVRRAEAPSNNEMQTDEVRAWTDGAWPSQRISADDEVMDQ